MPVFETGTFNHSVTCPHGREGSGSQAVYPADRAGGDAGARGIASFSKRVEQKLQHKKGRPKPPFLSRAQPQGVVFGG